MQELCNNITLSISVVGDNSRYILRFCPGIIKIHITYYTCLVVTVAVEINKITIQTNFYSETKTTKTSQTIFIFRTQK